MADLDYRAMCAELADALAEWQLGGGPPEDTADADLIDRARTLLAHPEPPADGEVEYALLEVRALVDELCDAGKWIAAQRLERAAELLQRFVSPACYVISPSPEALASLKAAGPGRIEALPAERALEALDD